MDDLINGSLEVFGAILLMGNCRLLWRHKEVRGVSSGPTAFFSLWGLWNLYFYPANQLWCSFFGGILLAIVNLTWVGMALYYARCKPQSDSVRVAQETSFFSVSRPRLATRDMVASQSTVRQEWYLHRQEGDNANAGYWYSRAGKPACSGPLKEEWAAISEALLGKS